MVKRVLGIESSCDECSAAVVELRSLSPLDLKPLGMAIHSQVELHRPYGGVVPEIASRNHLETINHVIDQALKDAGFAPRELDAIAVTNRPGLVGALLVGVSAAKAMSYALGIPLVAVHHLEGHMMSVYLENPSVKYPLLMVIVSGGHTQMHLIPQSPHQWSEDLLKKSRIGRSLDDAAGEAFDKTAKLLGFSYPGGSKIDQAAKDGDPKAISFPRALPQKENLDFSFSGLKTAAALEIGRLRARGGLDSKVPDLAASIQEAIVEQLSRKIAFAAERFGCQSVAVVGGVAANSRLRAALAEKIPGVDWIFPNLKYCTDNGAMIAAAGAVRLAQGKALDRGPALELTALPTAEF